MTVTEYDMEVLTKIADKGGQHTQTASKRAGQKGRGFPIVSLSRLAKDGYLMVRSVGIKTWKMGNKPEKYIFNDGDFIECYITAEGIKAANDWRESGS